MTDLVPLFETTQQEEGIQQSLIPIRQCSALSTSLDRCGRAKSD